MEEAIARGENCPECGAYWVDAPAVGKGARELIHHIRCPYWLEVWAAEQEGN